MCFLKEWINHFCWFDIPLDKETISHSVSLVMFRVPSFLCLVTSLWYPYLNVQLEAIRFVLGFFFGKKEPVQLLIYLQTSPTSTNKIILSIKLTDLCLTFEEVMVEWR